MRRIGPEMIPFGSTAIAYAIMALLLLVAALGALAAVHVGMGRIYRGTRPWPPFPL